MENGLSIYGSDSEEEMFMKNDYIVQLNKVHQNKDHIVDLTCARFLIFKVFERYSPAYNLRVEIHR